MIDTFSIVLYLTSPLLILLIYRLASFILGDMCLKEIYVKFDLLPTLISYRSWSIILRLLIVVCTTKQFELIPCSYTLFLLSLKIYSLYFVLSFKIFSQYWGIAYSIFEPIITPIFAVCYLIVYFCWSLKYSSFINSMLAFINSLKPYFVWTIRKIWVYFFSFLVFFFQIANPQFL